MPSTKGVQPSGMEELGSGRMLQWGGSSQGDGRAVGMWLGSCPCLQALEGPSPLLAPPWETQGQPVWASCPAEVCEAAGYLCCLAGSWHWILVLSLASPAAGFLHRNVSSGT